MTAEPTNQSLIERCVTREANYNFESSVYDFFGLRLQQHRKFLFGFNAFLNAVRFENIVELGTGHGGLTFLLNLKASIEGIDFASFDCSHYRWHDRQLRQAGATVIIGEIFEKDQPPLIASFFEEVTQPAVNSAKRSAILPSDGGARSA